MEVVERTLFEVDFSAFFRLTKAKGTSIVKDCDHIYISLFVDRQVYYTIVYAYPWNHSFFTAHRQKEKERNSKHTWITALTISMECGEVSRICLVCWSSSISNCHSRSAAAASHQTLLAREREMLILTCEGRLVCANEEFLPLRSHVSARWETTKRPIWTFREFLFNQFNGWRWLNVKKSTRMYLTQGSSHPSITHISQRSN